MIYVSAQWSISALHIIIKQKKKAKLYAAMWIMGERASIYAKNTSFDVHRCIEHCFFFFPFSSNSTQFSPADCFFVFVFIIVAFFFSHLMQIKQEQKVKKVHFGRLLWMTIFTSL